MSGKILTETLRRRQTPATIVSELASRQTMLLTDQPDLAKAEPTTLRYRLLHTAARNTHGQRHVFLRLAEH